MVYKGNIRHLNFTYSWIFSPFRRWFKGPICKIPSQPTKLQYQYLTSWEWGSAIRYLTNWIFIFLSTIILFMTSRHEYSHNDSIILAYHYFFHQNVHVYTTFLNMSKSVVQVAPRNISRHFCGITTRCFDIPIRFCCVKIGFSQGMSGPSPSISVATKIGIWSQTMMFIEP